MPNVYIVQRPNKEMDLSSALDYGVIRFVIEDKRFQPSQQPGVAQKLIYEGLKSFDPDEDYLLALGQDWCGIAMAGMALNRMWPGKPIKILRWERKRNPAEGAKFPQGFYTPSTIRM